jgi:putative Mg2+ transporter-C (MgtC) family protein
LDGGLVGQGWLQIGELALAFVLSALIGVEREIRHKSAGLRTYTLVGFSGRSSCLFPSTDVLSERVILDPSRIAAQIVTGIGFIGGGLIFVRRDSVRGLTTAAIVWLTAAVGMACGAGLPILALFVTALHYLIVFASPYVVERLPKSRWTPSPLHVTYEDGRGILRDVLVVRTQQDFAVNRVRVERESSIDQQDDNGSTEQRESASPDAARKRVVTVNLEVQGVRSVAKLAAKLSEIPGVISVNAGDVNIPSA